MESKLKKAAVAYAKHGFAVVPLSHSKKTPLVKFGDMTFTPEEVADIWNKFPNANIGLRTVNFFVVDIDRGHDEGDGVKSLTKAFGNDTWLKAWFESTLCEKTAHGGFHFFFKKPKENDINKQIIGLLPSVDLKADKNNYAVVCPSWFWDGSYKWLNHNPIKPAPSELLDLIRRKQAIDSTKTMPFTTDYSFIGRPTGAAKWLNMIANGLGAEGKTGQNPYGGRNNALTKMAGALLGYYSLSPETAARLVSYANANTPQPLPEKDVEATFNSVMKDELRRKEAVD